MERVKQPRDPAGDREPSGQMLREETAAKQSAGGQTGRQAGGRSARNGLNELSSGAWLGRE